MNVGTRVPTASRLSSRTRERRTRWLLAALLVAQLVLLSLQAPDPGGKGSLLEGLALRLVAPVPRLVAVVGEGFGSVSRGLALRRALLAENRRLTAEVEELRRQRVRSFGVEQELQRLADALAYTRPFDADLQVADVVYIDHTSWLQSLLIYVGSGRVEKNQPVVSPDGLVGRVILTSGPYAKVQLITDRAAGVGGMIQRTRRQGVVRGAGEGRLELAFVPLQADVEVGDEVVTAGIDGIYGRGVPVGVVTRVEPGSDLFHRIELAPRVDLGLLDQVYLLDREVVPDELREALPDAQP